MINIIEEGFMLAKKISAHSYLINLELHGPEKEVHGSKYTANPFLQEGRGYFQKELEHDGYTLFKIEGLKHYYKDIHNQMHCFDAVYTIGSTSDPILVYGK